jgi:hypothetical protein
VIPVERVREIVEGVKAKYDAPLALDDGAEIACDEILAALTKETSDGP